MKVIWLDDFREPAHFLYEDMNCKKEDITICKNYDEFVTAVQKEYPDWICFDHDLGEGKTGYDCAKWLINYCMEKGWNVPDWSIQSSNIVGACNIDIILKNYRKYWKYSNEVWTDD